MMKSESPWTAARAACGTESVSSAEPDTRPADHPRPRTKSPRAVRPCSAPAVPAISAATAISPTASPITDSLPSRSDSQPIRGEKAYMPAMCPLITRPTSRMSAPWWVRATGVIDMIDTIAVCEAATVTRARRARGDSRTIRIPARSERPSASAPAPASVSARAVRSGSGRSSSATTAAAITKTAGGPDEGPRGGRYAETRDALPGRGGDVRAQHRSDRGRPHHRGDGPCPVVRRGQVGGGEPGRQVRRGPGAEADEPDEEQREAADDGPEHRHPGPERPDEVREDEPGPAAPRGHQGGQRHREERGTGHRRRRRQSGEGLGAADVLGEDGGQRDARGYTETPEDLGGDEHGLDPAAERGQSRSGRGEAPGQGGVRGVGGVGH